MIKLVVYQTFHNINMKLFVAPYFARDERPTDKELPPFSSAGHLHVRLGF